MVCVAGVEADSEAVQLPPDEEDARPTSPAPRAGLLLMALILVVMALLAIYSNVQKARRDQIETVTIVPAPPVSTETPAVPAP